MADCGTNIISRLATRFQNSTGDRTSPDFLTRDIGGQFRNNQPFISGYFQVMFGLPGLLYGGDDNAQTASKWLHTTCETFTPHSTAVTKVDVQGQGQIGSSFPANVTTTREFTMTFREMQNFPILNIIRQWNAFDPYTGVSPLGGNQFIPTNYKGWVAVAQTKPVKSQDAFLIPEDLEECYIYQGVFPTTIPDDTAANADQTTNETVPLSVTFSFDNHPLTSSSGGISKKVVDLLNGLKYLCNGSTYGKYFNAADNMHQWGTHKNEDGDTEINVP